MWKAYSTVIKRYPRIPLRDERRLIRKAKKGDAGAAQELVLHHIGFVIFRIHKRAFPAYVHRFGEELLSQGLVVLHQKIFTYNLRYYDREGNFKPVRFSTYVWKSIDGLILQSLRKELEHDKHKRGGSHDLFERILGKDHQSLAALHEDAAYA